MRSYVLWRPRTLVMLSEAKHLAHERDQRLFLCSAQIPSASSGQALAAAQSLP